MPYAGSERRRHRRVYFNNGGVTGSFGPLDTPEQSVEAKVLNLSLGGLYITVSRGAPLRFRANETIIMYELKAPEHSIMITGNIMVDVKRVEDQPIFNHIGYGCQFIELDQSSRTRLVKFLEWQLNNIRNGV